MSSTKFYSRLASIEQDVANEIRDIIKTLGGKVCVMGYRMGDKFDFIPYTYFEVDNNGYGVALSIDMVEICDSGDVEIHLSDGDDTYNVIWHLSEMNAIQLTNVLDELEQIKEYHDEYPNEEVITEFSLDY